MLDSRETVKDAEKQSLYGFLSPDASVSRTCMLDAPSALALLKPRFGIDGFRAGQWEAIDAALRGHDSCVYLPTGSGKSLCFQATHPYHTLTPPYPTLPHPDPTLTPPYPILTPP